LLQGNELADARPVLLPNVHFIWRLLRTNRALGFNNLILLIKLLLMKSGTE